MTTKVPAKPMGEVPSKESSEKILGVPFRMPSTRLIHISLGSTNVFSRIVGSLIALSKLSDRVDQVGSSSKSNRAFKGGRKVNYVAGPLILKQLGTVLTEISKA